MSNDESNLASLIQWNKFVIDFMFPADSTLHSEAILALNQSAHNAKAIKAFERDLSELAKDALEKDQFAQQNKELISRFGRGFESSAEKLIKKILDKNKIETKNEYRLILEFVEAHFDDENLKSHVELANRLLIESHNKFQ